MSYPPGLLTYSLSPATVPTSGTGPSVVQLMLAVFNGTQNDVHCDQIGLTILAGEAGGRLCKTVEGIESSTTAGTHWSPLVTAGNITWNPDVGHETVYRGESVAFLISNIHVNEVVGLVPLTIYETTDRTRAAQVEVTKTDPGLGVTGFKASPVQINPGEAATLTWTTTGAERCTLSPPFHDVDLNGTEKVKPVVTTPYTLTAEGRGTIVTAQVTVVVPEVKVLNFKAEPDQLAKGAKTRLTWEVIGADEAVINPGRHKVNPVGGSLELPVDEDTDFTLWASWRARSDSQTRPVGVVPVDIEPFLADPAVVAAGNAARLSWVTKWATSCAIEPGIGVVPLIGDKSVTPTASTTYELHADGLEPRTAEVAVGVGAAITSFGFVADPETPEEVTVTWATFDVGSGSVTLTLPGGQPKKVAPSGTAKVRLAAGQWATVRLGMTVEGTTATASLMFSGPMVGPDEKFSKLQLACAAGINTPRATAIVQWVATKGVVHGRVLNAEGGRLEVDGASGSQQFGTGRRPPRVDLWQGDLQIGDGSKVHWQVM